MKHDKKTVAYVDLPLEKSAIKYSREDLHYSGIAFVRGRYVNTRSDNFVKTIF